MRTVWTIVGILVILIILVSLYKRYSKDKTPVTVITPPVTNPVKDISGNTTQREVVTERVIVPVFIRTSSDCNKQSYQDAVIALYDVYKQKRVIYNNGINTNDPNTIQYHKDMNVAYNAYYNEARKCNYFLG